MNLRSIWSAVKEVVAGFLEDQPFQLAGALSFYTLLSMAPLLMVVIGLAGLIFGEAAVRGELVGQIEELVGEDGAEAVQTILANAAPPEGAPLSMAIGIGLLLIGATTVFAQLQASLNQIWHVKASPRGNAIWALLRTRLLSLSMVIVIGFLLLVSLVISATLTALHTYVTGSLSAGEGILWRGVDIAVGLIVVSLLIAFMFKFLPDVRIAWRDVWFGAAVTAVLFSIGRYAIGLYLGQTGVASAYGAAGSLVVLLLWIYYSALIVFFGAEVTQVWARRMGKHIRPARYAIDIDATHAGEHAAGHHQ
ncbi:MAG: YihY/virulence factor BrkB family protein [Phycisphaeraceae bacterium]